MSSNTPASRRHYCSDLGYVRPQPAGGVCEKARDEGLIVITAGKGDVVRLVPPLIVTDNDVDQAIKVLAAAITAVLH